jgi:FkbM family methyltransferase
LKVFPDAMYVDPFLFGEYEPALTRLLLRCIKPGDLVVDVGSNFGWYAAVLGRRVAPSGRVHAFEPVPSLARLARETIELNHTEATVRLNCMGLGRTGGRFTVFTFAGLPHGHASATSLGRRDATPHNCEITTLDAYAADHGLDRIDLLKADVEGHELDVFLGARDVLRRADGPIVAFELNPICLADRGLLASHVEQTLRAAGYTEFWRVAPRRTFRVCALSAEGGDYITAKGGRAALLAAAVKG